MGGGDTAAGTDFTTPLEVPGAEGGAEGGAEPAAAEPVAPEEPLAETTRKKLDAKNNLINESLKKTIDEIDKLL